MKNLFFALLFLVGIFTTNANTGKLSNNTIENVEYEDVGFCFDITTPITVIEIVGNDIIVTVALITTVVCVDGCDEK